MTERPYRFLSVDDDLAERVSHKEGIDCATAESHGRFDSALILESETSGNALEQVNSSRIAVANSIDLIILDNNIKQNFGPYNFPIPGIGLLEFIRTQDPRAGGLIYNMKMPIIFCSDEVGKELIEKVHFFNATFFPKKYDFDKFGQLISATMARYEKEKSGLFVMPIKPYVNPVQANMLKDINYN
jgi:hypothetical protein